LGASPADALANLGDEERLVLLETDDEERATEILGALAKAKQISFERWDLSVGEGVSQALAALLGRLSESNPGLVMGLDLERAISDPAFARRLLKASQRGGGPILVIVGEHLRPARSLLPYLRIVPLPAEPIADTDRRVKRLLSERGWKPTGDPRLFERRLRELVRLLHGLNIAALARTVARCVRSAPELGPEALRIARAARRQQIRSLPFLHVLDDPPGRETLGGLDALKSWMATRRHAAELASAGKPVPSPRGMLLVGVPGCGKSLAAGVSASVLGVPLLRLDFGALRGGNEGPELRLLRGLAEADRAAPCVLWLDEIDHALREAGARGENHGIIGTLATWLQEHRSPVFVAATANDATALPAELARKGRFDEVFFVDLPRDAERAEILAVHMREIGANPDGLKMEPLVEATRQFTGSEIASVVREAAVEAAVDEISLEAAHIADAASRLVPLARTYDDEFKAMRNWARNRARPATTDSGVLGLFEGTR
jgi:hypothetical protein